MPSLDPRGVVRTTRAFAVVESDTIIANLLQGWGKSSGLHKKNPTIADDVDVPLTRWTPPLEIWEAIIIIRNGYPEVKLLTKG